MPRHGRTSPRVPSSPSARPLKSSRSSFTSEKTSWQSTSRACARGQDRNLSSRVWTERHRHRPSRQRRWGGAACVHEP
eukprot:scaffold23671_cov86-Isochrysis_galbana.AAC.2